MTTATQNQKITGRILIDMITKKKKTQRINWKKLFQNEYSKSWSEKKIKEIIGKILLGQYIITEFTVSTEPLSLGSRRTIKYNVVIEGIEE